MSNKLNDKMLEVIKEENISEEIRTKKFKYLISLSERENADEIDAKYLFLEAADNGRIRIAEIFLAKGGNIETKSWNGTTALMYASGSGHKEFVEFLLERGANIEAENGDRMRPVVYAAEYEKKEVVELLIEKGANIISCHQSPYVDDILYANPNVEIREMLDKAREKEGQNQIFRNVVSRGYKEIAEFLLEKGVDIDAKYADGETALLKASSRWGKEIVEVLLKNGADIEAEDKNGWKAEKFACNDDIRKLLGCDKKSELGDKDALEYLKRQLEGRK